MDELSGRSLELVRDGKNHAVVSIPTESGDVQTVVSWVHIDDDGNLTLNSAEGRAWPRNLRSARRATVTVMADANPYEYVSIQGSLIGDSNEEADAEIDRLAKKYLDADSYPYRQPGEQRVSFILRPDRVTHKAA